MTNPTPKIDEAIKLANHHAAGYLNLSYDSRETPDGRKIGKVASMLCEDLATALKAVRADIQALGATKPAREASDPSEIETLQNDLWSMTRDRDKHRNLAYQARAERDKLKEQLEELIKP